MLQSVKVQNFRKLRDKTFTFTEGLNVIRGVNEAGKSTLLEALAYAFFGVKGCRAPLEDIASWADATGPAAAVNKVKVELTFTLEGVMYLLKRSKSGADLTWGDDTVTGQNEVTAKIGRLFGVPPTDMVNLMLAQQGKLRGALDEGSKKTSELIEQLADFNIIDKVITLIGDKLLTGAPAPFEEKIGRLTPELAECEAALAVVPNTAEQEARLAEIEPQVKKNEETAALLLAELEPACAARDAAKKTLEERDRLQARVDLLAQQSTEATAHHEDLLCIEPPGPDLARMEEVQRLLADVSKVAQLRAVQREIAALPIHETFWTGSVEDFNNETNRVKARLQVVQKELSELTAEAREKRAQRVSASACGICGKDVSDIPEVVAKNTTIDTRLAEIAAREAELRAEMKDLAGELQDLEAVYSEHSKVERLAARYGELAAVDRNFVPWRLSWGGPALPPDDGGVALRIELGKLSRAQTDVTIWKTKVEGARAAAEKATKTHIDAALSWTTCASSCAKHGPAGLRGDVRLA
jgi:DNA repair exonuclease SbcCD ATPase subunit